jgi:hypothetical protein
VNFLIRCKFQQVLATITLLISKDLQYDKLRVAIAELLEAEASSQQIAFQGLPWHWILALKELAKEDFGVEKGTAWVQKKFHTSATNISNHFHQILISQRRILSWNAEHETVSFNYKLHHKLARAM